MKIKYIQLDDDNSKSDHEFFIDATMLCLLLSVDVKFSWHGTNYHLTPEGLIASVKVHGKEPSDVF